MTGANHPSSRTEWWGISCIALGSFALAVYGMHERDAHSGDEVTLASEIYQALQLFALHGEHLHDRAHALPWQLHAGRAGAAFVVFWTALKIAGSVLSTYTQLIGMVWRPGHVVVCGLGQLGLSMALSARRSGWRVVAIERNANAEGTQIARTEGIPVLIGNASAGAMLRRARVGRASRVWALTDDDDANVGVAALAGKIRRSWFSPKLVCRPLISEPRLRQSLRNLPGYARHSEHYRVETGPDLYTLRARHAFAGPTRALDHLEIPARVQGARPSFPVPWAFVIVGFGRMGEALALQAARIGHFDSSEKLRFLIVDERAIERVAKFRDRYEQFTNVCELTVIDAGTDDRTWLQSVAEECGKAHAALRPVTIAFCYDESNERNVGLALDAMKYLGPPPVRSGDTSPTVSVLVYLTTNCGLSHLLPENSERAVDERLHAFGALEEIWTLDTLENERNDKLAMQFHMAYLNDRKQARKKAEREGKTYRPRPAEVPWEELGEFYRDSNRAIADHVPVKLRALGYDVAKLSEQRERPGGIPKLSQRDIDVLAIMEHQRWCAHLWLDGWRYAPKRDDDKKLHPALRLWEDLPQDDRYIDEEMMSGIVAALKEVGEVVYERATRSSG